MKPIEFEQLQTHEFMQLWDGYQWREDNNNSMQAYWTSCLMSVHTKKPVKPTDLWKSDKQPKKQSKKEDEKHLREVFKLQGGDK